MEKIKRLGWARPLAAAASALAAEAIEPLEDFKEPMAEKQALNAIEKSIALAK